MREFALSINSREQSQINLSKLAVFKLCRFILFLEGFVFQVVEIHQNAPLYCVTSSKISL